MVSEGVSDAVTSWRCGVDEWPLMEPVPDAPGVQRCPHCGHRTDEPGEGLLSDGLDVLPGQGWLRGDVHVWRGVRAAVAGTVTPTSVAGIRAAFVDAVDRVAGVDLDHAVETQVHQPHLDHGGMSGGVVSVEWWRERAVPLMVQRALERRSAAPLPSASVPPPPPPPPSPPPPPPPSTAHVDGGGSADRRRSGAERTMVGFALLLFVGVPVALVIGGAWTLYSRTTGTVVDVTVLDCDTTGLARTGQRTECTASWELDGEVVIGDYEGSPADEGRTVPATIRGDTAYSRSFRLPIVLFAVGGGLLALAAYGFRRGELSLGGAPRRRGRDAATG